MSSLVFEKWIKFSEMDSSISEFANNLSSYDCQESAQGNVSKFHWEVQAYFYYWIIYYCIVRLYRVDSFLIFGNNVT